MKKRRVMSIGLVSENNKEYISSIYHDENNFTHIEELDDDKFLVTNVSDYEYSLPIVVTKYFSSAICYVEYSYVGEIGRAHV